MTSNDELPENIVNSLRDVTPAPDAVREVHIANALAEIRPASDKGCRRKIFVAAAAAVVVMAGGIAVMQSRDSATPAFASHEVQTLATVPAKGFVGSTDNTIVSACATATEKVVGSYKLDNSTAFLIETPVGIRIAIDAACDTTTSLPFPADRPSSDTPTDCSAPGLWEMLLVAHFADASGYFYWIGVNNQSIEMYDCSMKVTVTALHPQI